jgi:hypothetical protein
MSLLLGPGDLILLVGLLSLDDLVTVSGPEIDSFVDRKMEELRRYTVRWASMEEDIKKKEADFQALKERVEEDGCV